ncbi:FAD binding domain-containing protein [Lapillicoccus jejuensis]|uniref:Xanthine dehydrogenase YagS FAD-binding subunit n=1 Tax=Lapillicoccus jejuensis TaxID=402171 RepID=A0A542DV55_9MICO|nr:xanthine dehydrogenase family protein subunit M [Lapillicoccus jejuensis]TQJ06981.1 xanthine dehydrogenase YagS FAD-binding subunit [Lapillicoccus jejuensis]
MRTLEHTRATDPASAVEAVHGDDHAVFLAGGSNLVDHLKLGIARPSRLVDVSRLPLDTVEPHDGGLRIGATVRNSDLAAHPDVRERYEVLSRALLSGASGQIRHQATTAGNLLQRTRCVYFQDPTTACNKREPGSGCSALEGYGRYNAVLGTSSSCVATHPSDLAVALAVLDAQVLVLGPGGERTIPYGDVHRLPGDAPHRDTTLEHGDLVLAVDLPAPAAGARSTYRKVRDRASYAFALVSVAALVEMDGDVVRDVRVAWGGMAHKPWRASVLEEHLRGERLTPQALGAALDAELAPATTSEDSAYKLPMIRRTTAAVLRELARPATARTDAGATA